MKRIRYIKKDNKYVPLRRIKNVNNVEYDVSWMENDDGSCECVISNSGDVVYTTKKQSSHKIKIAIKRQLIKLGVVFDEEERGADEAE